MFEEDSFGVQEQQERLKDDQGFKRYAGIVLLIMGTAGAIWIFQTAYTIFNEPTELTLFQELVEGQLDIVIESEEKDIKVIIPKEFLTYQVPLFLLMISLGVVGVLVQAGVGLLDGSFNKLRRRIDALGKRLEKKISQN